MSWDVMITKDRQSYGSAEGIPNHATSLPLGSKTDVHNSVVRFFPGTDWSDASWGFFGSAFGSVEFNIGNGDPVQGMMLHVRASKEIVVPIIAMCREYGWNALDCSTEELLENSESPTTGLEGWRAFRDKVLGRDLEE